MSWIDKLARPDLLHLKPYDDAPWEPNFTRLHANELPWGPSEDEAADGLNRYPEPQPQVLLERLAHIYQISTDRLLLTRGLDEAIDLLVRAFCRAGEDSVLVCPPTFGMYAAAAQIQGAKVVAVPLRMETGFSMNTPALLGQWAPDVKVLFFCSPNDPTGNLLSTTELIALLSVLRGRALVVLDEAYIEFAARTSLMPLIATYPHLVVLRTLSKAHGLAGVRLGSVIADPAVIQLLRKLIAPYAIPQTTLEAVMPLLSSARLRMLAQRVKEIRTERTRVFDALGSMSGVVHVFPSEANFLLARFADAAAVLSRARSAKLLIRDARGYPGLGDALRITIGTREQNDALLDALQ